MLRLDTETLYKLELLDICRDGAYMGMWQILAAANILQHPICSVYPDLRRIVRPDLNRRVYCYNEALNTKRLLHIMWTPMSVNSQDPCHFVPLFRVVRRIQIVMKIYEFMNFTNFTNVFHFYICSAVKLPAIEKKLAQQKENQVKRHNDEQATRTQTTDEGIGTQRSSRTSAIVARDSMTASKFQMKGTLKEHKSKKQNIEEKPDVNTRKPIVKCNKLIVYDGTNTRLHDDSYYGGCTMPGSKGYSRLQTARRGKPYKGTPMGRSVSQRNLGNLHNAPGYLQIEEVEEQQYVSTIICDAEISVDNEVKYEDWCAAQGLIDLSSGSPDKNEECVSDEKLQKQIVSLNITLDLIHDFVQKNFISEEYERNIIFTQTVCNFWTH